MDAAYQALISQSSISAAVLARGADLALIELPDDAVAQSTKLIAEGYTLQGFVGLVNGSVEIAANDPLDIACMFAMGRAAQTFGQLLKALPKADDGASWLSKLYQLPDTREKFGPA